MLYLSVLVALGMAGMCLGASLPEPPRQEPLCPREHSCSRNTSDERGLWCSCDATCRIYGDCCLNSEYYNKDEQIKGVNNYRCIVYDKGWNPQPVYTKVRCSENWDDAEVQALCLKGDTLPDPMKRLAVTSTITARTYVNHYCAICNDEDPDSLRIWNAELMCDPSIPNVSNEDYAVVFHDKTWGVIVPSLGLPSFTPCGFYVVMPEDIKNLTKPCLAMTTMCSDERSEDYEQTLCQSYAAPVYDGIKVFRNQHCASCNGYTNYGCEARGVLGPSKSSLALLLDFTDHTANNLVGHTGSCGPEEVWDNMSGKCREIICPKPGEKFSYGRCAPAEDDATVSTNKQEMLCPLHHSCLILSIPYKGCSCDETCRIYGTCCRDSEFYEEAEQTKNVNEYMCIECSNSQDISKKHVYMRGKCAENWDNEEVQELCLKGNTLPDPTKGLPVTSIATARTYVNHYCAICNNEDETYLMMWYAKVMCERMPTVGNYNDYNYSNNEDNNNVHSDYSVTMYNEDYDSLYNNYYDIIINNGMWGISLPGSSVSSFTPCQTDFGWPNDLYDFMTWCEPAIKSCSNPESEEHEWALCQSYAAAVYHDGIRFRNQHCASCNGYKEHTCEATPPPSLSNPSFVANMEFDFSHSSLTGPCDAEEAWDRLAWKCRKIICSKPDEKFYHDRCVPVGDGATPNSNKQKVLCPFRHSCRVLHHRDRGCYCDVTCRTYGDCCRDSEYYEEAEQTKNVIEHMCVEYTESQAQKAHGYLENPTRKDHVYMKVKCSEGWDNVEVQELCLKGNTLPDPMKRLPVTSIATARTYVNHYCAICNDEDPTYYRIWNVYVMCEKVPTARSYDHYEYDYDYNHGYDHNYDHEDQNYDFTLQYNEDNETVHNEDYGAMYNKNHHNEHNEDKNILHDESYESLFHNDYDIMINDGQWGVSLLGSGVSSFIPCKTSFAMPNDIKHLTTQCSLTVKTCSNPKSTEHERILCQSYAAHVYHDHIKFRNQHCASCNGYKKFSCEAVPPTSTPPTFDLEIIFNFNLHANSSGPCGTDGVWDELSLMCRKVICPKPGEKFSYDKCVAANQNTTSSKTSANAYTNNISRKFERKKIPAPPRMSYPLPTSAPTDAVPVSQDPHDHLSLPPNMTQSYDGCLKVLLSETEFVRQKNGSVYVPAYGRTYQAGEYEAREGGVLVCWSADSSHKFWPTLGWVSLAGLCFSCLALVLHLIAFCLAPSLRNLSEQCLASLCLSLLAAYTTLLLNMMDPSSQAGCTALAASMYYFFLCSFAWMTAIAFDVWYTFRLTQRELRVAGGSQSHRFLAYSLWSWLLPAVPMAVLVTVDQLEPHGVPEDFLPRLGEGLCWISHRKSLLVFFATPMAALTLMNVVFFASTAALIAKMTRKAATLTAAVAGRQRPKRYWTFLRLAVLMGLTWTTGILAGCLDLEALWYVFVVLNSLQGVFIFLAFTCRTKVFKAVGSRGHRLLQRVVFIVTRRPLQPDPNLELQQMSNTASTSQGNKE